MKIEEKSDSGPVLGRMNLYRIAEKTAQNKSGDPVPDLLIESCD
jgi:hypothetical protein